MIGGFGGLLAGRGCAKRASRTSAQREGGDFGGTWYWNATRARSVTSIVHLPPLLEELGYVPKEKYRTRRRSWLTAGDRAEVRPLPRRLLPDRGDRDALGRASARGILSTNRGDRMRARFVCMPTGPLNRPKLPGIPASRASRATPSTPAAGTTRTLAATRAGISAACGASASASSAPAPRRAMRAARRLGGRALYVFQRTPSSDRRARQPPPRSGLGEEPRSRLQQTAHGQLQHPGCRAATRPRLVATAGPTSSASCGDGAAARQNLSPEGLAQTMALADFQKMEQIRARVDAIVADRATAEALKPCIASSASGPASTTTTSRPSIARSHALNTQVRASSALRRKASWPAASSTRSTA